MSAYNEIIGLMRQEGSAFNDKSNEIAIVLQTYPLVLGIGPLRLSERHIMRNTTLSTFEVGNKLLLVHVPGQEKYVAVCKVV